MASDAAWLAMALAGAAAACAGSPPIAYDFDPAPALALRAQDFPAAQALVDAFVATAPTVPRRAGHTAVFGIEVHRDGAVRRRLLQVDLPPERLVLEADGAVAPPTRSAEVYLCDQPGEPLRHYAANARAAHIRQFEGDGRSIGDSALEVYDEALGVGLWGLAAGDTGERDHSQMLLLNLQRLVDADRGLQRLVFEVLEPPGLWSVATNFGVHLDTNTEPREPLAEAWRDPTWGSAAHCLRATITLNGETAIADLVLTRPDAALAASLAVCGAVVRCGSDRQRFLVVRLLATGTVPALPATAPAAARR